MTVSPHQAETAGPSTPGVAALVRVRGCLWRWRCDCGAEFTRETWAINGAVRRRGRASCGCMWRAAIARNGRANKKPGTLSASERWHATKNTPAYLASRAEYIKRDDVRARWRKAANTEAARKRQNARRATDEFRAKRAEYARRRRVEDAKHRLCHRMSSAVSRGLSSGKQGRSWRELVAFTPDELRVHIERQFLRGMSWKNMGEWHIDHIVPLASFAFSAPEDPDFRAAWALTNLRPLWSADNMRKGAKRVVLL